MRMGLRSRNAAVRAVVGPSEISRFSRQAQTHPSLRVNQHDVGVVVMGLKTAKPGEKRLGIVVTRISQKAGHALGKKGTLHQDGGVGQPLRAPGGDLVRLEPADRIQLLGAASEPIAPGCGRTTRRRPAGSAEPPPGRPPSNGETTLDRHSSAGSLPFLAQDQYPTLPGLLLERQPTLPR